MAKLLFPSIIWSVNTEQPHIYLTFDDGPHPEYTPQILDILAAANAKATFFVVGEKAEAHPDIVRLALSEGHTLGIHSQTHCSLLFKTKRMLDYEIETSYNTLIRITSERPVYFRPPYGHFTPRLIKIIQENGMKMVMWTHMTYDFSVSVSDKNILHHISKNMSPGTIIVFHDGHILSQRTVSLLHDVIGIVHKHNMLCTKL
ncbi:polysaccharide deacetylase family protein [candidate division KSB1 bacterium]|nr:polysaccharide deacetylase family protein [candidate division KSB1 bacterium]